MLESQVNKSHYRHSASYKFINNNNNNRKNLLHSVVYVKGSSFMYPRSKLNLLRIMRYRPNFNASKVKRKPDFSQCEYDALVEICVGIVINETLHHLDGVVVLCR